MRIRRWLHPTVVLGLSLAAVLNDPYGVTLAITISAALACLFTGMYMGRSNWRATEVGKVIAWTYLWLSGLLVQIALSEWTKLSYPGREQVRAVLYTALAYSLTRLVITLRRIQNR
ncbi:MAG: putative phage holin [Mycobacterium sp.]